LAPVVDESKFIELLIAVPARPKPLQHSEMPPSTQVVIRAPLRPRLLKMPRTARPAAKRRPRTTTNTLAPTMRPSVPSAAVPSYRSPYTSAILPTRLIVSTPLSRDNAAVNHSRYVETVTVAGRGGCAGAAGYVE
jgi:hypothetical protein